MDTFRLSELEGTAEPVTVTVRGMERPARAVPAAVVLAIEAVFPYPRVPTKLAEDQGSKGTRTEPDHDDPVYQARGAACSSKRAAARVAWALNLTTGKGLTPPAVEDLENAEKAASVAAYFTAAAAEMLAGFSVGEIDTMFGKITGPGLVKQMERAAGN